MSMSYQEAYETSGKWFFQNTFGFHLSDLPSEEAYDAFTKAMMICTKGDGVLAPEERNWVIGFSAARGMPPTLIEEMKTYEATEDIAEVIARTSHTTKTKRAPIYFAIKACLADNQYHEGEQAAVREMAKAIGISEDELKQLEAICASEEELKEKRVQLLFPDGLPFSS